MKFLDGRSRTRGGDGEGEILGRTVHRLVEQGEITREGEILGRTVHRLVEQGEITREDEIFGRKEYNKGRYFGR